GFVESLHNRMRDELFEQECFLDLEHARYCIGQWCHRYNTYHPHSALGFIPPEEFKKQFLSKVA
ncbi:integrase core domain-containing protein, partial [Corynebacterium casei]